MNKLGHTLLNLFFEAPEPLTKDDKQELYPWLSLLGGTILTVILLPLITFMIG